MFHTLSAHSESDVLAIEAESGLTFAGFLNEGRELIPIFVRTDRSREERHAIVRKLNQTESK